jgi:hypothetical protein
VAVPALADESTVIAMAGLGNYMNDDTNQFVWPTTMNDYQNHVFLELNTQETGDSHQTAGATVRLPKWDANLGLYLNRPTTFSVFMDDYSSSIITDRYHMLMLGRGSWAFGFGIGGDKSEFDPDGDAGVGTLTEETVSFYDIVGGWEGSLFGNVHTELGANVCINSGERTFQGTVNDVGGVADSEESGFMFGAGMRNWYDRGNNGKLVSNLNLHIQNGNLDPEDPTGADNSESDQNIMAVSGGLGWHYPVSQGVTVIMVAEPFGYGKAKFEDTLGDETDTETVTVMQYLSHYFAMQAALSKHVVARVGIAQTNTLTTFESEDEPTGGGDTTTDESKERDSLFEITMGLGVKLGDNWWINGVFNEQALYTGPYLFTGESAGSLVSRVSVIGSFN